MKLSFVASGLLLISRSRALMGPMASRRSPQTPIARNSQAHATTILQMADFDFPSAMPDKPQLSPDQRMEESADTFIETLTNALGEGVEAPKELEALKEARASGAEMKVLASIIYELMIERGMMYDEEPETGTLTPTDFDIKNNLDIKEVKDEFFYLYKYGMMLMDRGVLTGDAVKTIVLERLIKRTAMSPEDFDKWLGY
jgi:hypothetical protein